jgi:hypothetical protein
MLLFTALPAAVPIVAVALWRDHSRREDRSRHWHWVAAIVISWIAMHVIAWVDERTWSWWLD